MRVDEDTPRHAGARRGQAKLRVRVRPVHRYGDAIDDVALRRREDGDHYGALGIIPPRLSHLPIGVAPFDVGELA